MATHPSLSSPTAVLPSNDKRTPRLSRSHSLQPLSSLSSLSRTLTPPSKLPSMGGTTSALHEEAFRLSLSSPTDPTLLPSLSEELAIKNSQITEIRWRSLLTLYKYQKHNTDWLPSVRQFLYVADELAPTGLLSATVLEIVLRRVYGLELAQQWAISPHLSLTGIHSLPSSSSGNGKQHSLAASATMVQTINRTVQSASAVIPSVTVNSFVPPASTVSTRFGPVPSTSILGKAVMNNTIPPELLFSPITEKKKLQQFLNANNPNPTALASQFSPSVAAKVVQQQQQEDETGHILVGIDPRTGLRSLAPPQPSNTATMVRMDDKALVTYLARGGTPTPEAFVKTMRKMKEREAILTAAVAAEQSSEEARQRRLEEKLKRQDAKLQNSISSSKSPSFTMDSLLAMKPSSSFVNTKSERTTKDYYTVPTEARSRFWRREKNPISNTVSASVYTPSFLLELTALWRDLWRGFSSVVPLSASQIVRKNRVSSSSSSSSSLAAILSPSDPLVSGPVFDVRLFAAAWSMLPLFRRCADPRFVLAEALRTMSAYDDDGTCISREILEAILILPVRSPKDTLAIMETASSSFLKGMTTPYRSGYAAQNSRINLKTILTKVLPNKEFDTILGAHPESHSRLPVTYYELMFCDSLRLWVAKRKAKRARELAASDLLFRKTLRNTFTLLAANARSRKVQRKLFERLSYLADSISDQRRTDAFYKWKMYTLYLCAVRRIQGFGRMVLARKEMRQQSAAIYLAIQIPRLFRYRRAVRRNHMARAARYRALFLIQRLFRGYRARKAYAKIRVQQRIEVLRRLKEQKLWEEEYKRNTIVTKIQRWYNRRMNVQNLFINLRKLANFSRNLRIQQAARNEVEEEVALKKIKRQNLDQSIVSWRQAAERQRKMKRLRALGSVAEMDNEEGGEEDGYSKSSRNKVQSKTLGVGADGNSLTPSYLRNIGLLKVKTKVVSAVSALSQGIGHSISENPNAFGEISNSSLSPSKNTNSNVPQLLPVAISEVRTVEWAQQVLTRVVRRVAARSRMRKMLIGRVERRYDLKTNQYYYVDIRDNIRWNGRPAMLGPRHELPVPDEWVAYWDPRTPEGPWFFNMRYHAVSWNQPQGTVLCIVCSRQFAEYWCESCCTVYCTDCRQNTHFIPSSALEALKQKLADVNNTTVNSGKNRKNYSPGSSKGGHRGDRGRGTTAASVTGTSVRDNNNNNSNIISSDIHYKRSILNDESYVNFTKQLPFGSIIRMPEGKNAGNDYFRNQSKTLREETEELETIELTNAQNEGKYLDHYYWIRVRGGLESGEQFVKQLWEEASAIAASLGKPYRR